jgi:RNA polymerase sigma-70 factor (ECF subfamily)
MSAIPSIHEPVPTPQEADHAGALYEEFSDRILGYCLRRLPSREEAEDAVQHTFLNAFRGLRQGVVPRSDAAWLFKIAENVCRERRRSAWRRSRVETVQDPDGLAGLAAAPQGSHDELAGLADALAELPPNQQRAILLREWQGLSYREIAEQLELTEAAVETLLFRARRSLAHKLDRSRARVGGKLGPVSVGGWGPSLVGGAAAKVATTAVVVAGILTVTPALRPHHPLGASASGRPHSMVVRHTAAAPDPSRRPSAVRVQAPAARRSRPARRVRGTVPGRRPAQTVARPSRPASSASVPKVSAPAVHAPKAPPAPVRAPAPPAVPAFTAPDLPPLETQLP